MGIGLSRHGLNPGAGMEPGHLVDYSISCVCPDVDLPTIWSDGEYVRGAVVCGDSHPAAVPGEGDILHTG